MLFRKKIPPQCAYCAHSAPAEDGLRICRKKGLVAEDGACRKFQYDPLQRKPLNAKAQDFSKYDQVDFSL